MGNALYRRLATHADATGATVGTIPLYPHDGVLLMAGGPSSSSTVPASWRGGMPSVGSLSSRFHQQPQFRKAHRACGTEDDPTAPFYAVAQHQFLRHVNLIQIQFCLFTLCLWNYLSTIRFVFGQDSYGEDIPPTVYLSWMIDGTMAGATTMAYHVTFDKRWIGLLYMSCCVAGLVSSSLLTCYVLWENRSAAFQVSAHTTEEAARDVGERVFLNRPVFVYTRRTQQKGVVVSGSEAYRALDAHAKHHDAYGDDSRGEVAPMLLYVCYAFVFVLCVIDMGVLLDLTLYTSSNSSSTNTTASAVATPSSSYGSTKVGSGMSFLGALVTFFNLLYVVIPPRRWYQTKAEAYLAARYY
jgi:hypothetical protein